MAIGRPPKGGIFNLLAERWPVLVHLAISIPLALVLNIRLDEAYTLQTTGAGARHAWHQAFQFELQPPLYFVLLSLWRKFDLSIFFARAFSIICCAAIVWLTVDLTRRYVKGFPPVAVAVIAAVHPFLIWLAVDIRVYAFALLLTALLLVLFHDGYLSDGRPRWIRWVYLLVAACALYTQYYLGFLLLANAIVLVVLRRWVPLRAYIWGMVGVGLAFLPMVSTVYRQFFVHSKDITTDDYAWTSLTDFLWIVKGYVLPAESNWVESVRRWLQLFGLPLLAILVYANRRRLDWRQYVPVWIIAFVLLPVFLVLRYRIGYDFFNARHTVALFFPVVLGLLALIWMAGRRRAVAIWLGLFLLASVVSLIAVYRPLAKQGDWNRVSRYLMEKEEPGQAILLFSPTAALPFSHYYRGRNQLVPLPRPETFDTYDVERYVLRSEDEIRERINSPKGSHERVWLVTDSYCQLQSVRFNCELLEAFVYRYYVVESDQQFYGSRVRLLRQREPAE